MKKTILILLLTFSTIALNAQTASYAWATSAGGWSLEEARNVTTDKNGNAYILGDFQTSFITFGTTTLVNMAEDGEGGYTNLFLVKYDPSGSVLWAKDIGVTTSMAFNMAYSVVTDTNNNVIITGLFLGDSILFGTTALYSTTGGGIFIAKYDASGDVLWVKSFGGSSNTANFPDGGLGLATDANNNIIITGYFLTDSIAFGTTILTNTTISGDVYPADFFIAKLDSAGNVVWAKNATGTSPDIGREVTVDQDNNIVVIGHFQSPTITFGTTTLTNITSTGDKSDIFIVKYDPTGNVLWAKSAGGTSSESYPFGDMFEYIGLSITTDVSNNVLITGDFYSDSITFGTTTLSFDTSNKFITKYDASGNVLWAKSVGSGDLWGSAQDVATDASDNIVVTGMYQDAITLGTSVLAGTHTEEIFIVKYDPLGNVVWAKSPVSSLGYVYNVARSVAIDQNNSIFATGAIQCNEADFGEIALNCVGLADGGGVGIVNSDAFLCKIIECVAPATPTVAQHISDTLYSSTAATYQWYVNGILIPDANLQYVIPAQNGDYTVCVTEHGGICKTCSAPFSVTRLAINEYELTNAITIYPNPNNGQFEIVLQLNTQDNYTLELTDALGQVLYHEELKNYIGTYHKQLDETKYGAGIYLFRVKNSKDQSVKKVISF